MKSEHGGPVNSAVFSADGSLLLTASLDRTAKVWDSCTGECKLTLAGHDDPVFSAVFSADGSLVLPAPTPHFTREFHLRIFDALEVPPRSAFERGG